MTIRRPIKPRKNGPNQAAPREFEPPGEHARDANRLATEPMPPKSLLAVLDTLAPINEDFPQIDDPLPRDNSGT